MPKNLEASEIDVRLGATWISPKYIQQFIYELLDVPEKYQVNPYNNKNSIEVTFSSYTAVV